MLYIFYLRCEYRPKLYNLSGRINGGDLYFSPQAERALIGLRGHPGEERLIVRFNRRKNMPQGCIMSRPCFCELSGKAAHQLRPVHFSGPLSNNEFAQEESFSRDFTIRNLIIR